MKKPAPDASEKLCTRRKVLAITDVEIALISFHKAEKFIGQFRDGRFPVV